MKQRGAAYLSLVMLLGQEENDRCSSQPSDWLTQFRPLSCVLLTMGRYCLSACHFSPEVNSYVRWTAVKLYFFNSRSKEFFRSSHIPLRMSCTSIALHHLSPINLGLTCVSCSQANASMLTHKTKTEIMLGLNNLQR